MTKLTGGTWFLIGALIAMGICAGLPHKPAIFAPVTTLTDTVESGPLINNEVTNSLNAITAAIDDFQLMFSVLVLGFMVMYLILNSRRQ